MSVGLALAALVVALAAGDATEAVGLPAEAPSAEAGGFTKVYAVYERLPALFGRLGVDRDVLVETQTARAWLRWNPNDRFSFRGAWQLEGRVSSEPRLAGGSTALFGGTGAAARRRLVDFDGEIAATGGMRLAHNLDELAAAWHAPWGDFTVGRQVLSWGGGRFWNPTDLLSPFAPTDVDKEVRHGVDAVRALVPLGPTAQLDVLWLPQKAARDNGAVVRGQLNWRGFDLAPSAAKYVRDTVVGLDLTGDAGPLGVHAEAAWTRSLDAAPSGGRDAFVRAVAGAEGRPLEEWIVSGEYYYNGWGAAHPGDYLAVLSSARVTRGEVFGAGRHYAGFAAAWLASELLTVQASTVVNVRDPSAMLVPVIEYWAAQEVLVRAGGYMPFGPGPSLVMEPPRIDLSSEYGASPAGGFVQLGIYAQ